MPEHVATLQLIGVAVLTVTAVAWAVVLTRLLRRTALKAPAPQVRGRQVSARWAGVRRAGVRPVGAPLPGLPRQRRVGPPLETVELTPAEQDAFAGLARQFASG